MKITEAIRKTTVTHTGNNAAYSANITTQFTLQNFSLSDSGKNAAAISRNIRASSIEEGSNYHPQNATVIQRYFIDNDRLERMIIVFPNNISKKAKKTIRQFAFALRRVQSSEQLSNELKRFNLPGNGIVILRSKKQCWLGLNRSTLFFALFNSKFNQLEGVTVNQGAIVFTADKPLVLFNQLAYETLFKGGKTFTLKVRYQDIRSLITHLDTAVYTELEKTRAEAALKFSEQKMAQAKSNTSQPIDKVIIGGVTLIASIGPPSVQTYANILRDIIDGYTPPAKSRCCCFRLFGHHDLTILHGLLHPAQRASMQLSTAIARLRHPTLKSLAQAWHESNQSTNTATLAGTANPIYQHQ